MPNTVANIEEPPRFPELPPSLMSARRRLWHRCVLRAISPLRFLGPAKRDASGILTYHRVANHVGPDPAMLNVSPARFRQQIAGLLQLGYKPVSLRSLVAASKRRELTNREFAIVFDDGYSDIFRHVFPVLRELNVRATVLFATAYLDSDQRFPFDDWSLDSAETSRPLSTNECRQMLDSGLVELGSHTHTHADFRDRPTEFRRDALRSLDVLREQFGVETPTFSFPYGFASSELIEAAKALGLVCALTADCQSIKQDDDPFRWGRFGATQLDTAWTLAAKLDGWYSHCQNAWRSVRRRQNEHDLGEGPTALPKSHHVAKTQRDDVAGGL